MIRKIFVAVLFLVAPIQALACSVSIGGVQKITFIIKVISIIVDSVLLLLLVGATSLILRKVLKRSVLFKFTTLSCVLGCFAFLSMIGFLFITHASPNFYFFRFFLLYLSIPGFVLALIALFLGARAQRKEKTRVVFIGIVLSIIALWPFVFQLTKGFPTLPFPPSAPCPTPMIPRPSPPLPNPFGSADPGAKQTP